MSLIDSPGVGALKSGEVASEVENPSRGRRRLFSARAAGSIKCDGHADRFYLAKPNTWGIANLEPIGTSRCPRPIR